MNQNIYQIKQYRAWAYVKTINPDLVKSDISFTANKNGGQGQLLITVSESFETSNYQYGDVIKVYVSNNIQSSYLIYTGFVESISKKATNSEITDIYCVWLVWLLKGLFYRNGWSDPEFTKNTTALVIITEIITNFNTDSGQSFTINNEIDLSQTVHLDFDHTYCFDAIKKVMENVDWYWYLDQNGVLNIKSTTIKHKATYKKNIQSLTVASDWQIYNRLHLQWWSTHDVYDDVVSQWLYGVREKHIIDTSLKDVWTMDDFAEQRLLNNAYPRNKNRLTITSEYYTIEPVIWDNTWIWDDTWLWNNDYIWSNYWPWKWPEWIEPWDWLRVHNFYEVIEWTVERIWYKNWFVDIELDNFDNFIDLIKTNG